MALSLAIIWLTISANRSLNQASSKQFVMSTQAHAIFWNNSSTHQVEWTKKLLDEFRGHLQRWPEQQPALPREYLKTRLALDTVPWPDYSWRLLAHMACRTTRADAICGWRRRSEASLITRSQSPPTSVRIWQLPKFIRGFDSLRPLHRVSRRSPGQSVQPAPLPLDYGT
jgi:hypothetical protein